MGVKELTIEATHECPFSCIHCSSNYIEGKLSISEIKAVIKEFDPNKIRWSGGEPFAYLTNEHLKIAKERNQIVTTNGHYTTTILSLADFFDEIRLSIYGEEKFHDGITGVKGSFARSFKLAKMLIKNKDVDITVTSPVWSEEQAEDVKRIAKQLNRPYRLTRLIPNGINFSDSFGGSCSTGDKPCNRENKRLIMPDGTIIKCASEKKGIWTCPYMSNID